MIAVNEAFWNQEMPQHGSWPANWVFGAESNMFSWNGTGWFADVFRWTRAAVAAAGVGQSVIRLFYNDYGIETATAKADAVLRFLKEQLAAGAPIDGVGFQAHMRCDCGGHPAQPGCNNATAIAANMRRFTDLGLDVWVTELDVAMAPGCTQQMQADVFGAVLQACLDLGARCDAFMLWGFTDRYTWLDNTTQAPNMLDAAYRPKPAYFTLQKTLAGA